MDYEILHEALSRKRMHDSSTDAEFAAVLVKHLASFGFLPDRIDGAGNIYYSIGLSRTLFCAHIDTAHRSDGLNRYSLDGKSLETSKWVKAEGDALGADDAAGISLLCWMMQNKVPGSYVFTRGEEVGGVGAAYIAETYPEFLMQFDRAVCFDRRGYHDVIVKQSGLQCASEVFGETLANLLCDNDLMYMTSEEGVYTDCREFIDFIPECVNISVGYFNEHGPNEKLNLDHVRKLAQAVLKIDWEALPVVGVTEFQGARWF